MLDTVDLPRRSQVKAMSYPEVKPEGGEDDEEWERV